MRAIAAGLVFATLIALPGCAKVATAAQVAPRSAATAKKAVKAPARVEIAQVGVTGVAGVLAGAPATLFLDVRQPEEYAEGHAPGAALRPLPDLAVWAAKLDKNAPLLVMCRSGHRSMLACNQLVGLGFTHITNVQGGFLAWEAAGLEIVQ
jgi:rhodanese-related sulfurtransferase